MLQAAAHDTRLSAIVSEGAGTRAVAEDVHMPIAVGVVGLPLSAVATAATAVFSDSLPPPRLEDLMADIAPRPVMLIWSSKGAGGEYLNPRFHDRAAAPKEIWEVPESTHINGLATRPEEYERRVVAFFDDALLSP
jgi:hypothetical protein